LSKKLAFIVKSLPPCLRAWTSDPNLAFGKFFALIIAMKCYGNSREITYLTIKHAVKATPNMAGSRTVIELIDNIYQNDKYNHFRKTCESMRYYGEMCSPRCRYDHPVHYSKAVSRF
jgi:hypothetical protein